MAKVFLISCASKKLDHEAKAKDLYMSPLFRMNLSFARKFKADKIYILSAKCGLLPLGKVIKPYNLTLNSMKDIEIKNWAKKVIDQLKNTTDLEKDEFIFLAGQKYRKHLIPYLKQYKIPLEGLGIGRQLQYLKNNL